MVHENASGMYRGFDSLDLSFAGPPLFACGGKRVEKKEK